MLPMCVAKKNMHGKTLAMQNCEWEMIINSLDGVFGGMVFEYCIFQH